MRKEKKETWTGAKRETGRQETNKRKEENLNMEK